MEEWRDIKGYEGLYQISNYGRARSLDRYIVDSWGRKYKIKGKIIKNRINRKRYLYTCLSKNGNIKDYQTHRLVADAFLDKNDFKYCEDEDLSKIDLNDLQVNHKDENKTNNNVDNLEYCTAKYNIRYGTTIERRSNAIRGRKIYSLRKRVRCVETNTIYSGVIEAAKVLNIDSSSITKCCKNNRKTSGGYHWEYADED